MANRSVIVFGVMGLAVLGLLAACGGQGGEPTRPPATATQPPGPSKIATPSSSPVAAVVSSPATTPATPAAVRPAASPSAAAASPAASPGATAVLLGDVQRGAAASALCLACHTTDGRAAVGPTWKGLYGSTVQLADGSTVVADAAYIHESIVDPNAKIHNGFPPVMTSFKGILTDQQIADIIAYIESLK